MTDHSRPKDPGVTLIAAIKTGPITIEMGEDTKGNSHFYVNPYEFVFDFVYLDDLAVGTVVHVATGEGAKASRRVTTEGQSLHDIMKIMGWGLPPHVPKACIRENDPADHRRNKNLMMV